MCLFDSRPVLAKSHYLIWPRSCTYNPHLTRSLEFEDLPPINAETSAKANADLFERHWRAEVDANPADPSFFRVARAMFGTSAFIAGALNGVANGIQARVCARVGWRASISTSN